MHRFQGIIAIEGIDGAGKTTITHMLQEIFGDAVCVYHRTQKSKITASILKAFPFYQCHALQVPIYLTLSIVNYFRCPNKKGASVMIMDRCFLSNICYYYPKALTNKWIYKIAVLFELKLLPDEIFIIDEDAEIAHLRDHKQKEIDWLVNTRKNYLQSAQSANLSKHHIVIIPNTLSIDKKANMIAEKIKSYMGEN